MVFNQNHPWSFIPQIYVATVLGSKRIPIVQQELHRLKIHTYELNEQIPPQIKSFENITKSCTDNHLQIYRKGVKHPFILVFEDDIYIKASTSEICDTLREVYHYISTTSLEEWDILYLGHFAWMIGEKVTPKIFKSVSWCTHAYFISQPAMKKLLKYTPDYMFTIGRICVPYVFNLFFKEAGGIDTFLAYQAHRGMLKSYCVYPMLVYQYSIKQWESKAKLSERMCGWTGGWWPQKLWWVFWLVVWLIIWVLSKRKINNLAK